MLDEALTVKFSLEGAAALVVTAVAVEYVMVHFELASSASVLPMISFN